MRWAALSVLLTTGLACGRDAQRQESAPPKTPLIEAVQARRGSLPIEETMPGVVRARNQVAIRPEISGRINEVLVRSGAEVELGQPLVRLDDVEARERLRQAEADVQLAEAGAAAARARMAELEARVRRTRALAGQELVSEQELESLEAQLVALQASADEAAARVAQRQAAVEERRSALAKTVVRAPVGGSIGERRAEVGMMVDPSTVLFVVGNLEELIIEVDLTEAMLVRVEVGLPVEIEGRAATRRPIRAELSRISPFLAAESFTTVGEIDVDNREGWLQPGMFVNVRVLVGQSQQVTLVPVSALWENPATGEPSVYVVDQDSGLQATIADSTQGPQETRSVSFRRVEVLAEGRGAAGVAGIEEGAWVVTLGQHLLSSELRTTAEVDEPAAGAAGRSRAVQARVRPISWQRVLELQNLQDEDLLEGFLAKQRTVAAALGAEIPQSEDEVERVLEEAALKAAGAQER
jgi:RND family efflux transporter MFP subunit